MRTLEEALGAYGFHFNANIEPEQKKELEDFWTKAFAGRTPAASEEIAVLESFGTCDFVIKNRDGREGAEAMNAKPAYGNMIFTLVMPDGIRIGAVRGAFIVRSEALFFECENVGSGEAAQLIPVSNTDVRFEKLLRLLAEEHTRVMLRGYMQKSHFAVTQIHSAEEGASDAGPINEEFLQTMTKRLLVSQVFPEDEDETDEGFQDFDSVRRFVEVAGITLPVPIRRWAERTLRSLTSPLLSTDERTHAQRALTMMMNIRWESTDFPPVDPWKAKKILDEELYGLETVKQRVVETIIQINRTHTLPSYGLLLVGPPGTGKSRLAYAVGRILKLPCAVLDMSTIRDPEALTGSPRVYINAKPGKIMEAFSKAGSSNIVFIINELDKADCEGAHGNPADVLLTLLDNLGFTDVYMECAIPTTGVYSIATANDMSKISGPILSRFSIIEIPDYMPEEKKIIFTRYSMPRTLKRMGIHENEVRLTDAAVDAVIRKYEDRTGCRELEQAAEHIAGHALFRIETGGLDSVTFDAEDVMAILGGD